MSTDDLHVTSDVENRASRRDNAERLTKFQQNAVNRRHSSRDSITWVLNEEKIDQTYKI